MNSRLPLVLLTILFMAAACGDPKEYPPKQLPPFDRIQSNGGVKFNFVTGPENKVLSTSLPESMYSASYGQLNINAPGGRMTIAIKDLKLLWCNSCSVVNDGMLEADTLNMYIHAGSVDLKDIRINGYLGLIAMNTGTYKFSGFAHFFNTSQINLVKIKAFDLVTDSVYVNSTSVLDTEVHAQQVVNVFINSIGDVIFMGDPPIVRLTAAGSGKLRKR